MRTTVAVAVACFGLIAVTSGKDADAAVRQATNIGAQGLAPALEFLAKQRNAQVVYRSELVSDKLTDGAAGDLTFEEALTQLLNGTRLTYRYLDSKAITIVPIATRRAPAALDGRRGERAAAPLRIAAAEVSGAPASATAQPPRAQAEMQRSEQLEEVVVTAQKRTENMQRVPIAVTAVSGEQLQAAGIVSANALSTVVAGLNINTQGGFFGPTLRGIGTTFFGAGVENPTALYIDNVYYGPQLGLSDLSDVEQIAVLRGPQGTLFGRNSTGGVIQMTMREPSADVGGEFRTEIDNYLTSRNFAYLTGGLTDDVKANLSLKYTTQEDAWGKNLLTGEDARRIHYDYSARSKLEWALAEATLVKIGADYAKRKSGINFNMRIIPGMTGLYLGSTLDTANPYDFALNKSSLGAARLGGGSVSVEHDFGSTKLTAISAYRQFRNAASADVDSSPAPANFIERGIKSEQFTQELQLASNLDGARFNWVVGAFYYRSRDVSDKFNIYLNDGGVAAGTPLANQAFYGGVVNRYENGRTLAGKSSSIFGQSTVSLTEATRLTAGLRYTQEDRLHKGPPTLLFIDDQPPIPDPENSPDPIRDTFDESAVTWRLALDHDFTDTTMGYLSYNRGFKSGGFNTNSPYDPPYLAEKVDTYEVGFKNELFDRRVRLNAAAFYNDYTNIQVLVVSTFTNITKNAPGAKTYGIDLEGQWQATEALSFSLASEWLRTKYTSYRDAPSSGPRAGGGIVRIAADATGNRLPFASNFTINAAANYDWRVGESRFGFNVTHAYNGGYFSEPSNILEQDSFSLLNSSLTWTAPGGRLSVSVWGRNLLDEAVPTALLPNTPNGYVADYSNPPRTYGLSGRYVFGAQ